MTNSIYAHRDYPGKVILHDFIPKPERELTKEEYQQMELEVMHIKGELDLVVSICDYTFFNLIQESMYKISEYNKQNKVFPHLSKLYGELVKGKKNADNLVKLCKRSEAKEIMPLVACILPCYANEYSEDGGVFVDFVCVRFVKPIQRTLDKLKNTLKACNRQANVTDVDFYSELLLVNCYCVMLQNIMEVCTSRLKDRACEVIKGKYGQKQVSVADLNFRTTPVDDFTKLMFHVRNIEVATIGDFKTACGERYQDVYNAMRECCHGLLNDGGKKAIYDIFSVAISDYTDYCIAKMIIHYRQHRELRKDVVETFVSYGLGNKAMNALMDEFEHAEICLGEHDAHEMKLSIEDIKNRACIDMLRKMLNEGTDEVKFSIVENMNNYEQQNIQKDPIQRED